MSRMYRMTWIVALPLMLMLGVHEGAAQTSAASQPAATQPGAGIQSWLDRGYFNLNLGFETTSGTLNDSGSFRLYEETGTKTVEHNVDSGSLIDFSLGARVWGNVSAGLGYHRGANSSEGSGAASVPHPVFFNQNRSAVVAASELDRRESAVHLQVGYMLPLNEQISVHVTGGPSFFQVKQELIGDITFSEQAFPFRSVNATPQVTERSDSVVGVNVGVDVTYNFWDTGDYRVGGGFFLRYAGASARISVIENEKDTDVGGLQFGFGARVRF
jgi:hypothetical protein